MHGENSLICMSNILQGEFNGISGWKHQSEGKNLKVRRSLLLALLFWGTDLPVNVLMFFAPSDWEPLLKYYYYYYDGDDGLSTTEVSIFAVTMKLRPGKVK